MPFDSVAVSVHDADIAPFVQGDAGYRRAHSDEVKRASANEYFRLQRGGARMWMPTYRVGDLTPDADGNIPGMTRLFVSQLPYGLSTADAVKVFGDICGTPGAIIHAEARTQSGRGYMGQLMLTVQNAAVSAFLAMDRRVLFDADGWHAVSADDAAKQRLMEYCLYARQRGGRTSQTHPRDVGLPVAVVGIELARTHKTGRRAPDASFATAAAAAAPPMEYQQQQQQQQQQRRAPGMSQAPQTLATSHPLTVPPTALPLYAPQPATSQQYAPVLLPPSFPLQQQHHQQSQSPLCSPPFFAPQQQQQQPYVLPSQYAQLLQSQQQRQQQSVPPALTALPLEISQLLLRTLQQQQQQPQQQLLQASGGLAPLMLSLASAGGSASPPPPPPPSLPTYVHLPGGGTMPLFFAPPALAMPAQNHHAVPPPLAARTSMDLTQMQSATPPAL